MPIELIFFLGILIASVVLHEVAHGYMANYLGDPTARLQGRLTLNPLPHIDPIGTILLPTILLLTSPILIGYAKPVPYNPYNLRGRYDEALIAFAGPATNILLALLFSLVIRLFGSELNLPLLEALKMIVLLNIVLAIFNLIPIPPLDGSKIISTLLPGNLAHSYERFRATMERIGILGGVFILLLFFFFLAPYFFAFIRALFALLTGVPL